MEIDVIGGQKWKVILEIPWLAHHNSEIDWRIGEVKMIRYLLWDALDMNNFYFLFLLFSDFIGILFSFSFSFLLDDEEACDIKVT